MDTESFQKYLKERYYDQINWYDTKSMQNQKWYKRFQWAIIILSAITPVLITLDWRLPSNSVLGWIPIITSVLVAISAAALKTFQYQEQWLNYRTTCETLRKEIQYYDAGIDEYAVVSDREALFVERVENLISRENTLWVHIRKEQNKRQNVTDIQ